MKLLLNVTNIYLKSEKSPQSVLVTETEAILNTRLISIDVLLTVPNTEPNSALVYLH